MFVYTWNDTKMHGFLAMPDNLHQKMPAVLVAPDWTGCHDFARDAALRLAKAGYIALAMDVYGEGRIGTTVDEKMALMQPLLEDRTALQSRLQAGFAALATHEQVDAQRIAAMGFCFGGLCVLDMARFGTPLRGVVSLHGLLHAPEPAPQKKIQASVLVLHGHDDPMVPESMVHDFCIEMTAAGADWQVHQYGHTTHAFTNPAAHDAAMGTVYQPRSAARAWLTTTAFLQEVFQSPVKPSHAA